MGSITGAGFVDCSGLVSADIVGDVGRGGIEMSEAESEGAVAVVVETGGRLSRHEYILRTTRRRILTDQ
jgi:hypothetical protein